MPDESKDIQIKEKLLPKLKLIFGSAALEKIGKKHITRIFSLIISKIYWVILKNILCKVQSTTIMAINMHDLKQLLRSKVKLILIPNTTLQSSQHKNYFSNLLIKKVSMNPKYDKIADLWKLFSEIL